MISSYFTFSKIIPKIGFNDVLLAIQQPEKYIIINTMQPNEQTIIIKGTLSLQMEEIVINKIIQTKKYDEQMIIIYGKNSTDQTIELKYKQLKTIGFTQVYVYYGGMFEWILLQEIYGKDLFMTNETNGIFEINILLFKPEKHF
jgi:hypothetical protein